MQFSFLNSSPHNHKNQNFLTPKQEAPQKGLEERFFYNPRPN